MELEQVRARLEEAMGLKETGDWWLDEAVRMIECYRSVVERRRVYDVSSVGARLRTAREIVGLTLRAQARRIDCPHTQLSRYERDKADVPLEVFVRLCLSLKVTQAWVLGDSDEGGPPMPGGVLRKQKYVNYAERSYKEKKRARDRADLERARGLRPPKHAPYKAAPAPSLPRQPPCPRCGETLSGGYCIADGCGYPGASWTPSWARADKPGQDGVTSSEGRAAPGQP